MDRRSFMKSVAAVGAVAGTSGIAGRSSEAAGGRWSTMAMNDLKPLTPIPSHISATGRRGMVSSSHPVATRAALWALERGGTAADAFITAAFAQVVLEPTMTTLGGGWWIHYYNAVTGKLHEGTSAFNTPAAEGSSLSKAESLYMLMRIMQEIWHTGIASYTPETHDQLVLKEYAREIWPLIENGPPRPFGGFDAGTCALAIVDGDGNMASGDHSISSSIYGTGIFVDGVVLNRVVPSGSKFPSGVTTSVWLYKDGKPVLTVASPSVAFTECVLQNVVNVVEYGMDLSESVLQPRFGHVDQVFGGTQIEGSFSEEILRGVEKRGMELMRTSPWYVYMGSLHGVKVDHESGTISGVADPRRRGMAKGI